MRLTLKDVAAAVAAGAMLFRLCTATTLSDEETANRCLWSASSVASACSSSGAEIRQVLQKVPFAEFHGNEAAEFCRQFGRPYIKAVSLAAGTTVADAEKAYPDAAAILVDSHAPGGHGGTGKTASWQGRSAGSLPLILAGGLSPANVATAVNLVKPWAVDVSSGVETAPGIKDAAAIRRFIEEARRGQQA
jgi:phosphoribosylanthranilate isomerase